MRLITGIVLGIVIFGLVYFAYGQLKANYDFAGTKGNTTGAKAADFTLKNVDGKEVSLSDYAGKPIVLNFWASWCPPCQEEMPNFNKLSQNYKDTGEVVFLMVNLTDGGRETIETAKGFLSDNGYEMNVLFDTENKAAAAYNISSIPATFFIDSNGNINNSVVGAMSMTQLEMEVQKLLTLN